MKKTIIVCSAAFTDYDLVKQALQHLFSGFTKVVANKRLEESSKEAADLFPETVLFFDLPDGTCNTYRKNIDSLLAKASKNECEYFAKQRGGKGVDPLHARIIGFKRLSDLIEIVSQKKIA